MADKVYLGIAENLEDVWTLTFGGAWASSETATITIAGLDLVLTTGTTVTNASLAEQMAKAFNATLRSENLVGDESRNLGGQSIPEFTDLTATNVGATVVLRGVPGIPVTVSVAETSNTGTFVAAHTQTATGQWNWDNAVNWDTGTVPVDNDNVWFDERSFSHCLFGFPSGLDLQLDEVHVTGGFHIPGTNQGRWLGLPLMNTIDLHTGRPKPRNKWYREYRALGPQCDDGGTPTTCLLVVGQGAGIGPSLVNWDQSADNLDARIYKTAAPIPGETPYVVNLRNDPSETGNNVSVIGGTCLINPDPSETGALANLIVRNDGKVLIRSGVTTTSLAVIQEGGEIINESAFHTLVQSGGRFIADGGANGASPSMQIGGEMVWRGGTLPTIVINSTGRLNFNDAIVQFSTTAIPNLYPGAGLWDDDKVVTFSNGINLNGGAITDYDLRLGRHMNIARTVVA